MIIRDRFTLGVLAGIVATVPALIVNTLSVALGFAKWYSHQIGGSIYLHRPYRFTLRRHSGAFNLVNTGNDSWNHSILCYPGNR